MLGVSFHPRLVGDLFEEGERAPDGATWSRLSSLLDEDEEGHLRFRRASVRDAAYAGLPFRTRRRLHGLAGHQLEPLCLLVGLREKEVIADRHEDDQHQQDGGCV